jgi:CRISPR-associated endoribonuclease Cas6
MHYFELTCTAYLKRDIPFRESFETLSKYLSFCLMRNGLEETHTRFGYKHFVFGGLLPFSPDQLYRAGSTYTFSLRSPDSAFITTLATALRTNIDNPSLLVVQTTQKRIHAMMISELYSATPVIVTAEGDRYWTMEHSGDIIQLHQQLHDNLLKKYHSFYEETLKPSHNFIQRLELKNTKPQNIRIHKEGKLITFFGNKFSIIPNEDEVSQRLAFLALSCGLGEKNSYGGGFCLSKGMR